MSLPLSIAVGGPIVYTLTGQNTASYTVSGTITTDGTIGSIGLGNVTSSNITVTDGTSTATLPALSDFPDVTASATALTWGGAFRQGVGFGSGSSPGSPDGWWIQNDGSGLSVRVRLAGIQENSPAISAPYTFATTGATGGPTVPEPSTLALLATGAIGLFAYRRRKRMQAA